MLVLLILLFFLLILMGFLLNRVGVLLRCDQKEAEVILRVWAFSIPIYPERKKRKKKKTGERKQKKEKKVWEKLEPKIHLRVNYRLIWRLLRSLLPVLLGGLHKLQGKIQVDELELRLVWAEKDPAAAAIHYGTLCGLAGNFLPILSHAVVIHQKKVDLSVDFQRDCPLWQIRVRVSITLAQLLYIGLYTGWNALSTILRERKKGKENRDGKETSGQ